MPAIERLVELRRQQKILEQEIAAIQEEATTEALAQYSAIGKKTFVYAGAKVQLQFWKKRPRPVDNIELERLDNLIRTERDYLKAKHEAEITSCQQKIKELQEAIETMCNSEELTKLKEQYSQLEEELTELQPKIAISL